MQKELKLWKFILERLEAGQIILLLVVAESNGSSPGRQGFKMAVAEDETFCGSIGGGIMEIKLVELAKARLKSAQLNSIVKKQIHRKDTHTDQSGMICSGEQTVLFVPLTRAEIPVTKQIVHLLAHHRPFSLRIESGTGHIQVNTSEKQKNTAFTFVQTSATDYVFLENLGHKHQLYLIGAGHCALALSELLSKLDFRICLLDDRPMLDTLKANQFVHEKIVLPDYRHIADYIPSGIEDFVVIMTIGYRTDDLVVRQLAGKSFRYIGMLGSKNKVHMLLEKLRTDHFPEEYIKQIHAPIGLPINSQTPEEIAVSIAAELIQEKNKTR